MKTLNISFDDKDFKKLEKLKMEEQIKLDLQVLSWERFVIMLGEHWGRS